MRWIWDEERGPSVTVSQPRANGRECCNYRGHELVLWLIPKVAVDMKVDSVVQLSLDATKGPENGLQEQRRKQYERSGRRLEVLDLPSPNFCRSICT